jgi:predicted dienelactone hydrolase
LREKVLEIVPEALHVSFSSVTHTHTHTRYNKDAHTHTMAPIESDVQVFNDEKRIARELYEHKWFTRYISI